MPSAKYQVAIPKELPRVRVPGDHYVPLRTDASVRITNVQDNDANTKLRESTGVIADLYWCMPDGPSVPDPARFLTSDVMMPAERGLREAT